MQIVRVGILGAGVMGVGVAQSAAEAGFEVLLVDKPDVISGTKDLIRTNLRGARLLRGHSGSDGTTACLDRIAVTNAIEDLRAADFVVENITEKWELKKPVYQTLDEICRPEVIFAANTSAISITRIASATRRADRVLGMHFMNPVPMKNMVEMIAGYHTSQHSLDFAGDFLKRMGKEYIVVRDSPGFVTNRVLMLSINEAVWLVLDRVAEPPQVDRLFRECFGHRMGPLETADLIGLDTILLSIEALYEAFADSKYRPCPLLKKMVDAGLYGRKSGVGFYNYNSVETDK